ncbi:hypothetical protein VDBG_04685 [Verticillium alfalfae VaMs.102]|uniref:Uncharacterized protein n=1 Tax=Verticillium alfalfae (strain VaMs.102 / ATCC MYA-4576 / FGSC 10136) TaxID=526221 RepID=C9SI03_VERA1|nr:hypothetical protein VDBG_04685 [Verticillium alfalfae VaMs.102]EEY18576.1 hypothetical protein VDBG_04685 [Verticillium alfalfae VaMs.102]
MNHVFFFDLHSLCSLLMISRAFSFRFRFRRRVWFGSIFFFYARCNSLCSRRPVGQANKLAPAGLPALESALLVYTLLLSFLPSWIYSGLGELGVGYVALTWVCGSIRSGHGWCECWSPTIRHPILLPVSSHQYKQTTCPASLASRKSFSIYMWWREHLSFASRHLYGEPDKKKKEPKTSAAISSRSCRSVTCISVHC